MSTSQPESTPAAPQTSRREEDEDEVDLNDDGADEIDEAEIEAMKKRVAEMEAEAAKLRAMTAAATAAAAAAAAAASSNGGSSSNAGGDIAMSDDEKEAVDSRSIYVGNVDYGSTPEEIQAHFASCGTINRVTILCDKYTGPKGYAYVEFADPSLVANAVLLNESMFRGRLLKMHISLSSRSRPNVPTCPEWVLEAEGEDEAVDEADTEEGTKAMAASSLMLVGEVVEGSVDEEDSDRRGRMFLLLQGFFFFGPTSTVFSK
ncbi:BQ2448_5694 [Microbotryum intermedium]|uniref:BQ2448_5694 protein n=1 Tax=Microbotryum intermedium TaxID=269621 RepID=A0A238F784_9BASI|nr:BQ2448_5694 [Microbotryum intermedium]